MEESPPPARKSIWNTYYPWLLGLTSTVSIAALLLVIISWIPYERVPGVPASPWNGPYLPGGLTVLFSVIAIRQVILRACARHELAADGPSEGIEPSAITPGRSHEVPRRWTNLGAWGAVGVTSAGLALVAAILLIAGFANGYRYTVVDQEARSATTHQEFAGTYSLVANDGRLCGAGDDYYACVEMHRAMYNSICVGRPLNGYARVTCEGLSDFISDTQARYAGCGYGCTTAGDGNWGWTYYTLEADTVVRQNHDARAKITHEERCDFDLGFIRFGSCPGKDSVDVIS